MEQRIEEIRENSRKASFCVGLTRSSFDEIVDLFFKDAVSDPSFARAMLAAISNIVLLNKELNGYYVQKFGSRFVNLFQEDMFLCQKDFERLIAEYRLLFLMLFHIEYIERERRQIGRILNVGYNNMLSLYSEYEASPLYERSLIELLKAIYSFYHFINTEDDFFEEGMGDLFEGVVTIFNRAIVRPGSSSLFSVNSLLKQLTSVLLLFLTKYQSHITKSIPDFGNYDEFFRNLADILKNHLVLFFSLNSSSEEIHHLTIILSTLNCIEEVFYKGYVQEHVKESKKEDVVKSSPLLKLGIFIPKDRNNFVFNRLLSIIFLSSDTSLDRPYSDMKSLMQLKNIILDLYYKFTSNEDKKVHSISFLKLFGYENIISFMEGNDLNLEGVKPEEYLAPDPEFMDNETTALRLSIRSKVFAFDNSGQSGQDPAPMDEKEKEREAEKLFHTFNEMEKSSSFPNFTNPVREWQQLGKFEELSDLGSED